MTDCEYPAQPNNEGPTFDGAGEHLSEAAQVAEGLGAEQSDMVLDPETVNFVATALAIMARTARRGGLVIIIDPESYT